MLYPFTTAKVLLPSLLINIIPIAITSLTIKE